jgi:hypothetical protein
MLWKPGNEIILLAIHVYYILIWFWRRGKYRREGVGVAVGVSTSVSTLVSVDVAATAALAPDKPTKERNRKSRNR